MRPLGALPDQAKGLLLGIAGVIILTPDSLLIRLISTDGTTLLFWRGLVTGSLLLAGFAIVHGRASGPLLRVIGGTGLLAAAAFAGSAVAFVSAIKTTTVANTLVILSAAPLFAALMARAILAEEVRPATWIAILAAVAGILVIVSDSLGGGAVLGDLSALAGALCIATSFTLLRRRRHINMIPAMGLGGLLVALLNLPFAMPLALSQSDVLWLACMTLVVAPASLALLTLAPRYLPAPEVSLLLLLETVLGPFWVWLVLDEAPNARAVLGGAIVVAALAGHAVTTLRRPAPA